MKIMITLMIFTFLNLASLEAAIKKTVSFKSGEIELVGDLYLPENYKKGDKLPAVIVTGSWTSVKEQMAGGYAQKLAQRGYIALAFDFRGWGKSTAGVSGLLKYVENPAAKTEDIIAAAKFLAKRPEVDNVRIASLGICASAGYATDAALQSDLIKTVAVVAPWYQDKEIVDKIYNKNIPLLLEVSKQARKKYETTKQITLVPAASKTDKTAVMQNAPYYTDTNRGLIPEYDNKFNVLTWEFWLNYDPIQTASKLKKPTLVVHSEKAAVPQGAKKYLEKAGNNAKGVWLENITQFDFYDGEEAMKKACDEVVDYFAENLK